MSAELQSILAPLLVLGALGYLAWTARRAHHGRRTGCAAGGSCACPGATTPSRRSRP